MKAIIFDSFGGPERLKVVEDYELPAKTSGEVSLYQYMAPCQRLTAGMQ